MEVSGLCTLGTEMAVSKLSKGVAAVANGGILL